VAAGRAVRIDRRGRRCRRQALIRHDRPIPGGRRRDANPAPGNNVIL
jgi:hypothetical protein